jgi:outer membrane cobalamin receptor
MRHFTYVVATAAIVILPVACGPYTMSQTTPAWSDRVIGEQEIARADEPNVWVLLQDKARQYYFVEDGVGRALAIHSLRGQSSIVLTSADMPMVIVDGARLVDYDLLQQMPLEAVQRIELMGSASATSYEGTNAGAGVIYIHTRSASSDQNDNRYSAGLDF